MKANDFMRMLGAIAVIVALIIGVSLFLPRYQKLQRLQARRIQLEKDNRQIEEKVNSLAEKQRRFGSDPDFVERTAREAGMVKSNEVSYRVVN